MKIVMRLLSILLMLSTFPLPIYSELLIVKKTDNGFIPLGSSDAYMNKDISEVLLKYQWPMCITSELSEPEQASLLFAGQSYAEELFIQKKLREKTKNNALSVIFIPTALYELFGVFYIFDTPRYKQNAFGQALWALLCGKAKCSTYLLREINNTSISPHQIRQNINHRYNNANALFYDSDSEETPHSVINQAFTKMLCVKYPELVNAKDALAFSDVIKNKSDDLVAYLINELVLLYTPNQKEFRLPCASEFNDCPIKLVNRLRYENENHIIAKTIALEYEARKLNKGLLLRGSSFEQFQVGFVGGTPIKKTLAGSTLRNLEVVSYGAALEWERVLSFEEAYKEKENKPYSISLGNSLFAGALVDCFACAYSYLSISSHQRPDTSFKVAGYALLIDKKDYIKHSNSNLFFIAPLSSLASLFQSGEYFHSRVKAAVVVKSENGQRVAGLFDGPIKDPTGVILITRDPLKHAALFSQFLAENGRMIQTGDESDLSDAEKKFVQDVTQAQIDAAKYYKAIQVLTPKVQTFTDKWKRDRE